MNVIEYLKELYNKMVEARKRGRDFCLDCMDTPRNWCWREDHYVLFYDPWDGLYELEDIEKFLEWLIKKLEVMENELAEDKDEKWRYNLHKSK